MYPVPQYLCNHVRYSDCRNQVPHTLETMYHKPMFETMSPIACRLDAMYFHEKIDKKVE